MIVRGGRTTVITSGNPRVKSDDSSSCAAVKCDGSFIMTAGMLNLKSTGEGGKGINSDKDISIISGELNVVTLGDKGVASPKALKRTATSLSERRTYMFIVKWAVPSMLSAHLHLVLTTLHLSTVNISLR